MEWRNGSWAIILGNVKWVMVNWVSLSCASFQAEYHLDCLSLLYLSNLSSHQSVVTHPNAILCKAQYHYHLDGVMQDEVNREVKLRKVKVAI